MNVQRVFARQEIKYILTRAQRAYICAELERYVSPDEFGRSTVCSLYCDTPSSLLIRRSLDAPIYKEKLRLRSYGRVGMDDTVYMEIKKKYDSVVYKRRVGMSQREALAALAAGELPSSTDQISRELDFMLKRYGELAPAVMLLCEREAFYARDDRELRVTFDEGIRYRTEELTLDAPTVGKPLTSEDFVLMELKAGGAIPLWMCRLLSELRLYKTSFSKYGSAYRELDRASKAAPSAV